MAEAQTRRVTKAELEESRLAVIVHHVSMQPTLRDLQNLVRGRTGIPLPEIKFGKPYEVNGERRQVVFLNFRKIESVDQFMKGGSLKYQGEELKISRHTPKSCKLSGHISSTILLTIYETEQQNRLKKELTEYDLKKYFKDFGVIIACDWQSSYEVMLQFQDYDSVDQIILFDVSHTINGVKVDVEKIRTKVTMASAIPGEHPYCIHVTNMPLDVTSDELSAIFSVHVAYILLQPGNQLSSYLASKDESTSEAWIKNLPDQQSARDFAKKHSRLIIRGFEVHCDVVQEPFNIAELCRDFEQGNCKYPADQCHYKHIMCSEPDECDDRECWFGHHRKRSITSIRRPVEDIETNGYRVRISNVPSTVTKEQLLGRLNIHPNYIERFKFPNQSVSNKSMVVYFINQTSENLLRAKIREWHNSRFSPNVSNRIRCQLERNMTYYDFDEHGDLSETLIRSRASSSASNTSNHTQATTKKLYTWGNHGKDTSSMLLQTAEPNGILNTPRKKGMKAHNQGPPDLKTLAPQWHWTGGKISTDSGNTADVYLLVDKKNSELNADIKVYRINLNQTAQRNALREKIILERLKGIDGIPKLIASNINDQSDIELDNEPWIIMEHINGVTLNEFVKPKAISFRDKSMLTLKLLNIVREMHCRNIVHRYIKLENIIIIKTQLDAANLCYSDQVNLFLIDFSQACFIQSMTFPDAREHIQNTFYQVPQLERQPSTDDENRPDQNMICSPTIDTSSICAVLFWLITDEYPREARDIHGNAPHQQGKFIDIINEQVKKATGKFLLEEIHHYFVRIGVWTESERGVPLKQHLQLIFDRGFAYSDQQWPIEELNYQLEHILRLATKNNEENSCFSSPLSKKQMKSSLNTSKPEYFLQLALMIDSMKRQFAIHYPDIHWSTDNQSRWSQNDQQVRNRDFLTFEKQQKSIVLETLCCAEINKNQELVMIIKARDNQKYELTLPLGIWKQYEQEHIKEEILKIFQLELKILIDIFYKKKFM